MPDIELSALGANTSLGTTTSIVTTNGSLGLLASCLQILDAGLAQSATGSLGLLSDDVFVQRSGSGLLVPASAMPLLPGPTLGMGGQFVRPRLSTLTQINSTSGDWSEPFAAEGPILFHGAANTSGSFWELAVEAVTPPVTKVMLVEPQNVAAQYQSAGLVLGDGSGKILLLVVSQAGGNAFQLLEFNSPTSYNNTFRQFTWQGDSRMWYKVSWDGTTLTIGFSVNGIQFDTYYSGSMIFLSGLTQIGLAVSTQSTSGSFPPTVTAYFWHFNDTVPS
jgi:hypothetical protein